MANITIKELATLAETSVATVSRVLNGDTHVAEETRQRIQQLIYSTGYTPRKSSKRDETTKRILAVLPSLSNPFFFTVLRGIESAASIQGYSVLSCVTHRDAFLEDNYLKMIKDGTVDGAILLTSSIVDSSLDTLCSDYPVIMCGATGSGSAISYVAIDDKLASYDAITYLVGLGHTKIATISYDNSDLPFVALRHQGYIDALKDHAITYTPAYEQFCDNNRTAAYDAMNELMNLPDPPTAVFTFSDLTATGVYNYLYDHKLIPGKDMDVLAFDGTYLSESVHPKISSVKQPGAEMGKIAFNMLKDRLGDPDYVARKIILRHELISRGSTHKLKNK